jgi:hypothetical protein
MNRKFRHWLDPRLPQPPRNPRLGGGLIRAPFWVKDTDGNRVNKMMDSTPEDITAGAKSRIEEIDNLPINKRAMAKIFGPYARRAKYNLALLIKMLPQMWKDGTPYLKTMCSAKPQRNHHDLPDIDDL